MIKAKVTSFTIEEAIGSITKLDLGAYIDYEYSFYPNAFYGIDLCEGLEVVIMTKEEYKAMDSVSDFLRNSLLNEREKTKELEEENKDLKKKVERLKEELFFFYKGLKYNERVSELEKEVEELNKSKSDTWLELNTVKAENERLQKKIEDLEEKLAKDAYMMDIHPDGTTVFRKYCLGRR